MGYHEYFEYDLKISNLSDEEIDWLEKATNEFELDDWEDNLDFFSEEEISELRERFQFIKSFVEENDQIYPSFEFNLNKKKRTIEFFPGEGPLEEGPLQLAKMAQAFLARFRPDQRFGFRWIRWDNRGHDTYDGGAYIISATGIVSRDSLKQWLAEKVG